MNKSNQIPIVVGVTGHRNICAKDVPALKQQVSEALVEVRQMCGDTPVVMMSGMAQGADMLCAEVAFEMNIPVYAVLPFDKEHFYNTFDDYRDRDKLYPYLDKCARIIYVPDVEQRKDWLQSRIEQMDDDSYWYRQVGVHIAERSHLTIALWDGKAPRDTFGCGTVEVIEFALEQSFLNKDRLFKPATLSDSSVIWIKTNRNQQNGDFVCDNTDRKWLAVKNVPTETSDENKFYEHYDLLTQAPDFLVEAINETVAYNKAEVQIDDGECHLWTEVDELSDYHKNLRSHYIKADKLSYQANRPKYKSNMLALAILGALMALCFLMYDEAALRWMIIPCTIALGVIIAITIICRKRSYHANYIKYRALAEALRIQFYLTLSLEQTEGHTNVCDLYSWSQKVKFVWIRKAISAIDVVSDCKHIQRDIRFLDKVKEAWIGKNRDTEGQISYHVRKKSDNKKQRDKLDAATQFLTWITITLYGVILVLEATTFLMSLAGKTTFWAQTVIGNVSYRNIGAIILGTLAATSLLFSSYWGKLSFGRQYDDNDKMSKLYLSAYARWTEATQGDICSPREFENFVKGIAREEIVENGIWSSYVEENTLDITV